MPIERTYSAERYIDSSVIIFFRCSIGVIPSIFLKNQQELNKLIGLLEKCRVDDGIPKIFYNAFEDDKEMPC